MKSFSGSPAEPLLKRVGTAIDEIVRKKPKKTPFELIEPLTQLRLTAETYGFNHIAALSAFLLDFLNRTKPLEKDAIEIIVACRTALDVLSDLRTDDDQETFEQLKAELEGARRRYNARHQKTAGLQG